MSTVSTQSQLPKGFFLSKKMKRLVLLALFFGLFIFSMSIFVNERFRSHHHSDVSVYKLAEEMKELKKNSEWSRKSIERLYQNQQKIIIDQGELREIKDSLFEELSRVENIALQSHESYRNIQVRLQQQDQTINSLVKTKAYNQGNSQEKSLALVELYNSQKELVNKLENFKNILQVFEAKFNANNRKITDDMKQLTNWVAQNSVTKDEVNGVLQANQNTQRQLINEVNNQKNLVNQVSQNSLKQGNELKEVTRVLNGLKDYTLDAVQQLGQQNTNNERRINIVEKSKVPQGSTGKQGNDNGQLATEFKNFKEYTLEALQELRAFNNRNTKRINHIQSKESEESKVPISDMVSQEVEKFFNNLGDGKLLQKILEETNISMEELHKFIDIVKMLAEGDINGVMKVLNQLAGGNLMEQLMNAKKGLLKEFKPVLDILNGLTNGDSNLNDVLKYASWFGDSMKENPEKETPKQHERTNNQRKQKAQKKRDFDYDYYVEY